MKWFRTKPEDKLWKEIDEKGKRGYVFFYLIIYLIVCVLGELAVRNSDIHDIKAIPFIVAPFLAALIGTIWYLQRIIKEVCRRIQKQEETMDKFKQILGITDPSKEITVKDKEKLINSLITMLDNTDKETRRFTAQILGELGNPRALSALSNLLMDSDKTVVSAAMRSIEKLTLKA